MGKLGAFGHACRTTGVEQAGSVLGVGLNWLGHRPGGCKQGFKPEVVGRGQNRAVPALFLFGQGEQEAQERRKVLLDVGDDHVAQSCTAANAVHPGVVGAEHNGDLCASVGQLVLQLGCAVEKVAGHGNAACPQDAIEGDDELGAVGHNDGNPIAPAHAELLQ